MSYSGLNSRSIYRQSGDFSIDFRVYDYTSDFFFLGLSTPSDFGLLFKSGLIYDSNNLLVGTFNGQPVSFEGSRLNNFAEYSINGVPINRGFLYTGIFDNISANIYDNGYINFDFNLRGKVPDVAVQNMFSSSGISGELFNSGTHEFKIFNLYSNDFTGTWNFDPIVPANDFAVFSIERPNTVFSGDIVNLNFETNFGLLSYNVPVDSESQTNFVDEDYYFASLALVSGNSRINSNNQSFIYSVLYNTNGENLNIYFDYIENQSGDFLVYKTGFPTGSYSGFLQAISGLCSGTLYQIPVETFSEYYEIEPGQGQVMTFEKPSSVQYQGYPQGEVTYTYNYYNDLNNSRIVPRPVSFFGTGNYPTDLGGYFGTTLVTGGTYDYLLEYSNLTGDRTLYGDINSTSFLGKYEFTGESYSATGLFRQQAPLGTGYIESSFEGRLYRGVAYCFLPDDYSFYVTGQTPTVGGFKITGLIDSRYNCLLYKDVPNFSGSGLYVFSGLISGRILSRHYSYYLSGGDFGLSQDPNNLGYSGFAGLTNFILRGGRAYDSLDTLGAITTTETALMAGPHASVDYVATGDTIDFGNMSFVAHLGQQDNGQYYPEYFKYNGDNPQNLFAVPLPNRFVETNFTGQLPYPITGYIQEGYFRHYITSGNRSGMFLEEKYPFGVKQIDQNTKTNINTLLINQFNGQNSGQMVNKIINVTSPVTVSQTLSPYYTGYLESGYFLINTIVTGVYSGYYTGFIKNIQDIWTVSVSDNIDSGYTVISQPPFIDGVSRYRYENTPVAGAGVKYVKVIYSGKSYSGTGLMDRAQISFTLNTASGSQIIR